MALAAIGCSATLLCFHDFCAGLDKVFQHGADGVHPHSERFAGHRPTEKAEPRTESPIHCSKTYLCDTGFFKRNNHPRIHGFIVLSAPPYPPTQCWAHWVFTTAFKKNNNFSNRGLPLSYSSTLSRGGAGGAAIVLVDVHVVVFFKEPGTRMHSSTIGLHGSYSLDRPLKRRARSCSSEKHPFSEFVLEDPPGTHCRVSSSPLSRHQGSQPSAHVALEFCI